MLKYIVAALLLAVSLAAGNARQTLAPDIASLIRATLA
jgi:hypothetical protein